VSTLSIRQAYRDARKAGFNASQAVIIVAIAMAESGLRSDAIGPVGEIGITQVYPVTHPQYSRACLLDPQCNFNAYEISNHGTNWHPWTTYNEGTYKQYLPQVEKVAGTSANLFPDPSAPQQPIYSIPAIDSSSQDNTGLAVLGIGTLIAGAAVIAIIVVVVWVSIK